MNQVTKASPLQAYQFHLCDRALHPELVDLKHRSVITHGTYELECWISPGGHMLRFERGKACLSELVTDTSVSLPGGSTVASFPCAGERDFDEFFERCDINYMTTVQSEQLSENLYLSTLQEMQGYGGEVDAPSHTWTDEAGTSLSMLDIQRHNREIHVQSYHLRAAGGVVLRTQTIFEHR